MVVGLGEMPRQGPTQCPSHDMSGSLWSRNRFPAIMGFDATGAKATELDRAVAQGVFSFVSLTMNPIHPDALFHVKSHPTRQ
jgi:hypothetical protein